MLKRLINHNENCVEVVSVLLSQLHVKVTVTGLKKSLQVHPDYPSMLSVSDVLSGYGIENIAFNCGRNDLENLPVPFITMIKSANTGNDLYCIVQSVSGNRINYYDPEKHKQDAIEIDGFVHRWCGIVLIVNGEDSVGEKNYTRLLWPERLSNAGKYAALLALPVITILSGIALFVDNGIGMLLPWLFTVFALTGTIFSGLLLWYGSDDRNPVIRKICSTGKIVNCAAILNSNVSKIAGISWSAIGFAYFLGETLLLLFSGISNGPALFITAWLNTLAIPYVFFSIFYQARIAKQWCVLCICVQGVLVTQLTMAFAAGWHTFSIPMPYSILLTAIISFTLAYLFSFIMGSLLLPAIKTGRENKQLRKELQQLKYNPEIFETLLSRQKRVEESTEGMGIILGNPNSRNKLIKVCNPYCEPCSKAHTLIDELLHSNEDIALQILFLSRPGDFIAPPVRHLLAIAESATEKAVIEKALNDWYLAEKKEYSEFAAKYPLDTDLKAQDIKLEAMYEWCGKTGISYTPAIFLNGHELPAAYTIDDLKYLLFA